MNFKLIYEIFLYKNELAEIHYAPFLLVNCLK